MYGQEFIPPDDRPQPVLLIPPDQHLVTNLDVGPLLRLIDTLPRESVIAVDTETSGLHPYEGDRLLGVSLAWGHENIRSFYLPVGHAQSNLSEHNVRSIFTALKKKGARWVMHNGKFDLVFLQQLPKTSDHEPMFLLKDWFWDTMVVAWLHDENVRHGLKEQAAMWWGDDEKDEQRAIRALVKERGGWSEVTPAEMANYAAKDAEQTLRLYYRQLTTPPKYGEVFPETIEREMRVQRALYRMEQTAIRVDPDVLVKQLEVAEARVSEIESYFRVEYDLNICSPKQLGEFLYGDCDLPCLHITRKGARQVNRAALEELENQHPAVPMILEHRRLKKAVSAYYLPLADRLGLDGRIHPSFKATGTVTGRFSCSDPNLQTIPRGDTLVGVRDVFVAEDGYELWEYDLAAAELRVMAGWAKDERMIGQLEEGRDMHSENALAIFGEGFTGLQRRICKNIFYGWCYGIGPAKAATYMVQGEPVQERHVRAAREVLDGYNSMYAPIARLMRKLDRHAKTHKFIPLHPKGRYRRFHSPGVVVPTYTAFNAIVQGGIGEFMKDAMCAVEPHLDYLGARLCLQVHDSFVIEVPPVHGLGIAEVLQTIADSINPFKMRMLWDAKPWSEHD